jgi:hypothetical protein
VNVTDVADAPTVLDTPPGDAVTVYDSNCADAAPAGGDHDTTTVPNPDTADGAAGAFGACSGGCGVTAALAADRNEYPDGPPHDPDPACTLNV